MLITIIFSLVTACAALSLAAELRRDLMMMQQNRMILRLLNKR